MTTRSQAAAEFRRAVRGLGEPLRVMPVETGSDWMRLADHPAGDAMTYTEALRFVRAAGYRVMTVGGVHGLDPTPNSRNFYITVYPAR